MGDEGEMRLMKGDVAEKILEEAYGREDYEEFSSFVEGFAQGKSDENIEDLVLKLYEFSMSYPYPREWLEECRRAYQVKSREELENAPWMGAIKGELRKQMEEAEELLSQAMEIAGEGDGPGFYIPLLEEEKKSVENRFPWRNFFSGRKLWTIWNLSVFLQVKRQRRSRSPRRNRSWQRTCAAGKRSSERSERKVFSGISGRNGGAPPGGSPARRGPGGFDPGLYGGL